MADVDEDVSSDVASFEEACARARRDDDPYLESLTIGDQTLPEGFDLTFFELHGLELSRCCLAGVNLAKASLYDCTLTECDLTRANLTESFLARTRLVGCKLEGCDLTRAIIRSSRLIDCQCRYLNGTEAKFENATLARCDLSDAFLSELRLKKPLRLEACDLTRVDFFRTSLAGIDLSTCEVTGIQTSEDRKEIRGAIISAEQAPDIAAMLGVRIKDMA